MDDDLASLVRSVVETNDFSTDQTYRDKSARSKRRIRASFKESVYSCMSKHKITSETTVEFLKDLIADISGRKRHRDEDVAFVQAAEAQYSSLSQPDKRVFTKLLTLTDGIVNKDMVNHLPFLKKRCIKLHKQPERKDRSDKIDLSFISDFMHEHCRYFVHLAVMLFKIY